MDKELNLHGITVSIQELGSSIIVFLQGDKEMIERVHYIFFNWGATNQELEWEEEYAYFIVFDDVYRAPAQYRIKTKTRDYVVKSQNDATLEDYIFESDLEPETVILEKKNKKFPRKAKNKIINCLTHYILNGMLPCKNNPYKKAREIAEEQLKSAKRVNWYNNNLASNCGDFYETGVLSGTLNRRNENFN